MDPSNAVVTNTLFLARGNLVLSASGPQSTVSNLVVSNNRWFSEGKFTNDTIVLNEAQGKFVAVLDSYIESNAADSKWQVKGTHATRSAPVPPGATNVSLSFAGDLLFPTLAIAEARCSLQAWTPVAHAIRPPAAAQPTEIQVLFAAPVEGKDAVITCTVDQSVRTHAAH